MRSLRQKSKNLWKYRLVGQLVSRKLERWKVGKVESWKGGKVDRWTGGKVDRWKGGKERL